MKLYRLFATMGAAAVLCGSLCACGGEPPASTVITKAPEDVVIRTQTTTTVATTTTTLPDFMFPTTDHQNGTSADGQTTPTTVVINDSEASASGKAIAQLAVSLVGTPFEFGGSGPDSFDNPGFVVYCYKQNGFSVPSRAAKMATWGEDVPPDMIQAGDIVVFANDIGGKPSFCGIYIGDEQFVACNNPDSPTKVQKLDSSYWGPRFVAARRPSAEG